MNLPTGLGKLVPAGSKFVFQVHYTPTGTPHAVNGGTVYAERGISDEVVDELKRRGHVVERASAGGGYQGILIDAENGVLIGASEPRKDGQAVGY